MENITRRELLQKASIGTTVIGAVGLVGLEASCSTSTILADLDTIVGDAIIVSTSIESSPILGPVSILLLKYLNDVKAGVDAAITINNNSALSAVQKAADIAEIFVNLAVADIPGLPSSIAPLVGALEVAINTLLGLLHSTASASFVKTHPHFSLSLSATGHLSSHNNQLGKSIAKAVAAAAAANVGAK